MKLKLKAYVREMVVEHPACDRDPHARVTTFRGIAFALAACFLVAFFVGARITWELKMNGSVMLWCD